MASALTAAEVRRRELMQLLADRRSLINAHGVLQPTVSLAALPPPWSNASSKMLEQWRHACSFSRSAGIPAIDLGPPPGSMSSEKGQTKKDAAHPQSIHPLPGLERPQQGQELQLYVISLSTPEGEQRREMMCLRPGSKYEVSPGVLPADVPQHVIDHWYNGRMGETRNRALKGAFAAHWEAWQRIAAAGDKGALVLEDDCVQYRAYPQLDKYSHDGITLLGGCFKGFSSRGGYVSVHT